jgi:hypothetical protein
MESRDGRRITVLQQRHFRTILISGGKYLLAFLVLSSQMSLIYDTCRDACFFAQKVRNVKSPTITTFLVELFCGRLRRFDNHQVTADDYFAAESFLRFIQEFLLRRVARNQVRQYQYLDLCFFGIFARFPRA